MDVAKDDQILEPTASLQCGWWKSGIDLLCCFSEASKQLATIWLKSENLKTHALRLSGYSELGNKQITVCTV